MATPPDPSSSPEATDPIQQLAEILKDANATVRVGLRQQGKFDRVAQMVRDHAGWTEIGRAIGWHGPTVADWFALELLQESDAKAQADAETIAQLKRRLEISERQYDRLALCPDHRDKATGRCIACDGETRSRRAAQAEIAALRAHLDACPAACCGICGMRRDDPQHASQPHFFTLDDQEHP